MLDCDRERSRVIAVIDYDWQFGMPLTIGNRANYLCSHSELVFQLRSEIAFTGPTFAPVEPDHPVPFFAQNDRITWLGDNAHPEMSVVKLEDIAQFAPGGGQRSDSISLDFVDDAIAREESGDLRGSLRLIYQRVDEMIRFGIISALDEELANLRAETASSDVLLGLLTATLPVRSQLRSRRMLFKATKRLLKSRGHYERGILDGLR
jgi:hypothetical protein